MVTCRKYGQVSTYMCRERKRETRGGAEYADASQHGQRSTRYV
jgi:hypothetical protein